MAPQVRGRRRRGRPSRGHRNGIRAHPALAAYLVDDFGTYQTARAIEWVENLPEETTHDQARTQAVEEWGDTRYLNDALAALSEQQEAREQERRQRGTGRVRTRLLAVSRDHPGHTLPSKSQQRH